MRLAPGILIAVVLYLPTQITPVQAQPGPGPAVAQGGGPQAGPAGAPDANAATISATLSPSLDTVHKTLAGLKLDRWKKGTVRDDASTYVDQIQHDIGTNMPPLMATADEAPNSVGKALPLAKHLGALYDVLLRVEEAARVSAPDDQVAQLQSALNNLETARLALNDHMQGSADAMEKQVVDLRGALRQQASRPAPPPAPVAVPCTPPVTHHTVVRKKPTTTGTPATTAKPGTTTPNTQKKPATTGTSQTPPATSH